MTDGDDGVLDNELSVKDLAEDLQHSLDELGWSAAALMDRMRSLGDYRTPKTILRGINRALAGEIRPSGELCALIRQAVFFQRRLLRTYSNLVWTELGDGSHTTRVEDFTLTLVPQRKSRWLVNVVHTSGYSPSWPRWQDSLEAAMRMALVTLDNGQNWVLDNEAEKARDAAEAVAG
jgi:hypothetical protein